MRTFATLNMVVPIRSTTQFSKRRITRRIGGLKRMVKKLFTFDFKGLNSSRPGSTSSTMSTCTDEDDNKENRPPESDIPFDGDTDVFETPSSNMEDDDERPADQEGLARLRELEQEMGQLRTQFHCMGEGFSFLFSEAMKHLMNMTSAEYEAKFEETVREGVKSEIRCTSLEDELRRSRTKLYQCERRLEVERINVMQLKDFTEAVKAALAEELEKQGCRKCNINLRNTVIFPCMHCLYCSDCLHDHQRKSLECPICRTPIQAAINLNLKTD